MLYVETAIHGEKVILLCIAVQSTRGQNVLTRSVKV